MTTEDERALYPPASGNYDPETRPCLGSYADNLLIRSIIGSSCPVCNLPVWQMIGDVVDQHDGSATGECSRCRSRLRMNPHGTLFQDR